MKHFNWIKQNPLTSFVLLMTVSFFTLWGIQAKASDDDSLTPLVQPMSAEMVTMGDSMDTHIQQVVIVDKTTGETEGYGVIQWVKAQGKAISEKSHDLYDKWAGGSDSLTPEELDLLAPEDSDNLETDNPTAVKL
jgi:hypothetical protein